MARHRIAAAMLLAAAAVPAWSQAADASRMADVARRGADVMPFDLKRTIHIFVRHVVSLSQGANKLQIALSHIPGGSM